MVGFDQLQPFQRCNKRFPSLPVQLEVLLLLLQETTMDNSWDALRVEGGDT